MMLFHIHVCKRSARNSFSVHKFMESLDKNGLEKKKKIIFGRLLQCERKLILFLSTSVRFGSVQRANRMHSRQFDPFLFCFNHFQHALLHKQLGAWLSKCSIQIKCPLHIISFHRRCFSLKQRSDKGTERKREKKKKKKLIMSRNYISQVMTWLPLNAMHLMTEILLRSPT